MSLAVLVQTNGFGFWFQFLVHSRTSFRANLERRTPLGVEAKRYMDAGDLVPDEVTVGMVRARLAEPDTQMGSSSTVSRTAAQATALDALLGELGAGLDAVVEFAVPDDVVVERLVARGRSDDTEDVIWQAEGLPE